MSRASPVEARRGAPGPLRSGSSRSIAFRSRKGPASLRGETLVSSGSRSRSRLPAVRSVPSSAARSSSLDARPERKPSRIRSRLRSSAGMRATSPPVRHAPRWAASFATRRSAAVACASRRRPSRVRSRATIRLRARSILREPRDALGTRRARLNGARAVPAAHCSQHRRLGACIPGDGVDDLRRAHDATLIQSASSGTFHASGHSSRSSGSSA
jgi:hypothetical protein